MRSTCRRPGAASRTTAPLLYLRADCRREYRCPWPVLRNHPGKSLVTKPPTSTGLHIVARLSTDTSRKSPPTSEPFEGRYLAAVPVIPPPCFDGRPRARTEMAVISQPSQNHACQNTSRIWPVHDYRVGPPQLSSS